MAANSKLKDEVINFQRNKAKIAFIIALVSFIVIYFTLYTSYSLHLSSKIVLLLSLCSIFFAVIFLPALLTAITFFIKSHYLDVLINHPKEVVGYWKYFPHELDTIAQENDPKKDGHIDFIFIFFAIAFILLGVIFITLFTNLQGIIMCILSFIISILAIVLGNASESKYHKKLMTSSGYIILGKKGAIIFGQQYKWQSIFSQIKYPTYNKYTNCLTLRYVKYGLRGSKLHEINLKVPNDSAAEAQKAYDYYSTISKL